MNIKDYFKVGEAWGYYFRKKDPNRPTNVNLKMMHWSNKISMFMFLVCAIVIIYRLLFR